MKAAKVNDNEFTLTLNKNELTEILYLTGMVVSDPVGKQQEMGATGSDITFKDWCDIEDMLFGDSDGSHWQYEPPMFHAIGGEPIIFEDPVIALRKRSRH